MTKINYCREKRERMLFLIYIQNDWRVTIFICTTLKFFFWGDTQKTYKGIFMMTRYMSKYGFGVQI